MRRWPPHQRLVGLSSLFVTVHIWCLPFKEGGGEALNTQLLGMICQTLCRHHVSIGPFPCHRVLTSSGEYTVTFLTRLTILLYSMVVTLAAPSSRRIDSSHGALVFSQEEKPIIFSPQLNDITKSKFSPHYRWPMLFRLQSTSSNVPSSDPLPLGNAVPFGSLDPR